MRWVAVLPLVFGFALVAPASARAAPPDYYPPIDWIPAARANYDVGRTMRITAIVIHETDGSYLSALNWFQNPRSHVSAHYLVRAWGGGITQFVAEGDTAYHARAANPWTIGIEHEYNPRQAIWHTDAQYRSSATTSSRAPITAIRARRGTGTTTCRSSVAAPSTVRRRRRVADYARSRTTATFPPRV
ncbi:MAG: N-acetylmuramoyl-L-alanine amidase [Actinobacteria bacterium]|nr:MAG: N-acetylmuramoyl-L-alanine amidase [Actinomycetota bacterium]